MAILPTTAILKGFEMIDCISYVPDLTKFKARIKGHYESGTDLAEFIRTDGEDNFWLEGFWQTGLLYLTNQSLCLEKIKPRYAYGLTDEDGEYIEGSSIFDLMNKTPARLLDSPVIELWATGTTRTTPEANPFSMLSDDQIIKLREFWPESVEYTDEEGETYTQTRGLEWERLV